MHSVGWVSRIKVDLKRFCKISNKKWSVCVSDLKNIKSELLLRKSLQSSPTTSHNPSTTQRNNQISNLNFWDPVPASTLERIHFAAKPPPFHPLYGPNVPPNWIGPPFTGQWKLFHGSFWLFATYNHRHVSESISPNYRVLCLCRQEGHLYIFPMGNFGAFPFRFFRSVSSCYLCPSPPLPPSNHWFITSLIFFRCRFARTERGRMGCFIFSFIRNKELGIHSPTWSHFKFIFIFF